MTFPGPVLHTLAFVLARSQELPGEGAGWPELVAAQERGLHRGRALRIFRMPEPWPGNLDELVSQGNASFQGEDPLAGAGQGRSLICDALVPELAVPGLWLGVYALSGSAWPAGQRPPAAAPLQVQAVQLLDRFALAEATNETCWFYPTDNGTYLSWENPQSLTLLPGWLPEQGLREAPIAYDRGEVHLLWSLMADDSQLTGVGLTYQRRRIDWSLLHRQADPSATWTCFTVDTMADPTYSERACINVFPDRAEGRQLEAQ